VATVQSYDVGVHIRGERFEEGHGAYPFVGIALHGPNQEAIADTRADSPGEKKAIEVPIGAGHGGRFYLLVGNAYADQHKNGRFGVQLVDISDARSGRDAGDDEAGAIDLEPGTVSGYLNANDHIDCYTFKVKPNVKYAVRVKPSAQEKELVLTILDRDGVEKKELTAPNGGAAVRIEGIDFSYDGKALIRVANRKYVAERVESPYSLELTSSGGEGAPPATTAAAAGAGAATGARPAGSPKGAAPAQPAPAASSMPMVWIGLGALAVAGLVGVAFRLGRSSASRAR
jgi:hypothetical protein